MLRLMDIAAVLRSKNAGAFVLTVDVVFKNEQDYRMVIGSDVLRADRIALAYRVQEADVSVIPYPDVWSIKITMPRRAGSGDVNDSDVYGAQQHVPLMLLEVPTA